MLGQSCRLQGKTFCYQKLLQKIFCLLEHLDSPRFSFCFSACFLAKFCNVINMNKSLEINKRKQPNTDVAIQYEYSLAQPIGFLDITLKEEQFRTDRATQYK